MVLKNTRLMLKLTIAILAAILLTACGGPAKRTEKQQEKTILCGGYTQQRPLEASERELFRQVAMQARASALRPSRQRATAF